MQAINLTPVSREELAAREEARQAACEAAEKAGSFANTASETIGNLADKALEAYKLQLEYQYWEMLCNYVIAPVSTSVFIAAIVSLIGYAFYKIETAP